MSSVIRSVLGAALLLTGASTAIAQNAPAAGQPVQTAATTTAATAPAATAPAAAQQPSKPRPGVTDNSDPYGGHDPNSAAGIRAFFEPAY
jgi:hypothetical protein